MIAPSTTLDAVVDRYALGRELAATSIAQHRYSVLSFSRHLGRAATIADLTDDAVSGWLVALADQGQARETIRTKRRCLLTLWRAWCEDNTEWPWPRRVRKIKRDTRDPQAWDEAQFARLVAFVRGLPGTMKWHGVAWADFWTGYVLLGYDTGLRFGDLITVPLAPLAATGVLWVRQGKTGTPVSCELHDDLRQVLARIVARRPEATFVALYRKKGIQEEFKFILRRLGLPGSTKWLRRTGATWTEVAAPGSAMAYLGHKTPGLAYRHYVDPRHVQAHKPRPPRRGVE